jgi:hypothetical protein
MGGYREGRLMLMLVVTLAKEAETMELIHSMSINETQGFVVFKEKGLMIATSSAAHLMLEMDPEEIRQADSDFTEVIKGMRFTVQETRARNRTRKRFEAAVEHFRQEAAEGSATRSTRGIEIILAAFLGLFNTARISEVKGKLDHTNEAVKVTAKQADALAEFTRTNAKNLEVMKDISRDTFAINMEVRKAIQVDKMWISIERQMDAATEVTWAAAGHRLHPHIDEMIDMEAIWGRMKKDLENKGWVSVVTHWRHLLNLPVSVAVHQGKLHLICEFPIYRKETVKMTLYRRERLPLWLGGHLLEIVDPFEYWAMEQGKGTSSSMTVEQVQDCVQIGRTYHCKESMVRYTEKSSSETCNGALHEKKWEKVAQICPIVARQVGNEAWPVGPDTFLTVSDRAMAMICSCSGQGEKVFDMLPRTMYKVVVPPTCTARTASWTLVSGKEQKQEVQESIRIRIDKELWSSLTKDRSQEEHIQRALKGMHNPKALGSISEQVAKLVEQSGFSVGEITGMVMGGLALIIILGFLLYLYVKSGSGCRKQVVPEVDPKVDSP